MERIGESRESSRPRLAPEKARTYGILGALVALFAAIQQKLGFELFLSSFTQLLPDSFQDSMEAVAAILYHNIAHGPLVGSLIASLMLIWSSQVAKRAPLVSPATIPIMILPPSEKVSVQEYDNPIYGDFIKRQHEARSETKNK